MDVTLLLILLPVTLDEYTACLAAMTGVSVDKAILRPHNQRANSSDPCSFQIRTIHDFAMLPYTDASVSIISARSLHKGVRDRRSSAQGTPGERLKEVKDCLAECNRILVPNGRLEYIFFEDELTDAGPLTKEMEPFFREVSGDGLRDEPVRCRLHSESRRQPH